MMMLKYCCWSEHCLTIQQNYKDLFMALTSGVVTCTTSPTLITSGGSSGCIVSLHNSSAAKIYIGGSTVSVTNGYHLSTNESLSLTLLPGNSIYGVASATTKDLAFFSQNL
jgi:hypothetical protein